MDIERRKAAFEHFRRRVAAASVEPLQKKARQLRQRLFKQQLQVIDDTAKRKAVLCARRAGKSFTFAAYLALTCLETKNANCLFVAITRVRSQEILWRVLKRLSAEFELDVEFHEARLVAEFSNGSRISLRGCENQADVDKFRGEAYHLVILDEAATWSKKLFEEMLSQAIEPTLGDYQGTLVMGGTPGKVLAGPFYEATGQGATDIYTDEDGAERARSRPFVDADAPVWDGVVFAWSLHGWDMVDNTSDEGQAAWKTALENKKRRGWSDDNPIWLRESVGRWIADDSNLVFRYSPERDDWEPGERSVENPFGLPAGHAWRYVIGCDMGFHDPFAMQVFAYSDTHPTLYQVYEYEAPGLTVGAIAQAIQRIVDLVGDECIEGMCADLQGLGGTVVETLAVEHDLVLEKMEQKDKRDHIELVNADFVDGRVKLFKGSRLGEEMLYLAWDDTGLKPKSSQPNHACDAALGARRLARHREAREPLRRPVPGSLEHTELRVREEEAHVAASEQRRARDVGEEWQPPRWQENDWFSEG